MRTPRGFTLIELLIAAAIAVVLLGIVTAGLRSGASTTVLIQTQQRLLEDLRATGNFVADTLAGAAYVYPPGTRLSLNTASSYTVHNPATGNNTWVVGLHRMIAALLPPQTPGGTCSASQTDGCVAFVAFYALPRKWVVDHACRPTVKTNCPGPDPANDTSALVVYYYLRYLADTRIPDAPPTHVAGSAGTLLADYIDPKGFQVRYLRCTAFQNGQVLRYEACPPATPTRTITNKYVGASQLTLDLKGRLVRRGRAIQVPRTPLEFHIAPRNLPLE